MRVNQVLPIVDQINFTLRTKAIVDTQMQSKYDNGKAVDGMFEIERRITEDLKSNYLKDESGILKFNVITGQIFDWTA